MQGDTLDMALPNAHRFLAILTQGCEGTFEHPWKWSKL